MARPQDKDTPWRHQQLDNHAREKFVRAFREAERADPILRYDDIEAGLKCNRVVYTMQKLTVPAPLYAAVMLTVAAAAARFEEPDLSSGKHSGQIGPRRGEPACSQAGHTTYPFCDTKKPIDERVNDLVSRRDGSEGSSGTW